MKVILLISNNQTSPFIHKDQTPVALIKFGGKYLLEHLLNELLLLTEEDLQDIIFVTSSEMGIYHDALKQIATKFNLKTSVFTCYNGNSTLDALACASEVLKGPVLIMPSNAWFKGGSTIKAHGENLVLVSKVDDPSEHSVVKLEMNNAISAFYENSNEYISDLSPVGGYFFKDAETIISDIQDLLSEKQTEENLLDLTQLIEQRIQKGDRFLPSILEGWNRCENIDDVIKTHRMIIAGFTTHRDIGDTSEIKNTVIISPVFIGENAKISNSVIGPYVSIGDGAFIENAILNDTLLAENTHVENVKLSDSMLGHHAIYEGKNKRVNLGNHTYIKE